MRITVSADRLWHNNKNKGLHVERPTLFWFDMTITTRHADVGGSFHEHFDVRYHTSEDLSVDDLAPEPGTAMCFEFDYPDRPGLSLMCNTKERFPHIPIIMLTSQHSERLAVWAYRNRVLDYLVKPVSEIDYRRCRDLLQAIGHAGGRQSRRPIIDRKATIPIEVPGGQRTGTVRLGPAIQFVKRNFREKIRNADVADICGMSSYHFSHAFTETFGLTFQEFVLRYRVFEACKELHHPNVPVANVAYSVGFNDPSYFARVFRRYLGMSPSEYCERISIGKLDQRISAVLDKLRLPELEPRTLERRQDHSESRPVERVSNN